MDQDHMDYFLGLGPRKEEERLSCIKDCPEKNSYPLPPFSETKPTNCDPTQAILGKCPTMAQDVWKML